MPKTRILVIEDDDDARMMYVIMLRSWGYEVIEATTGRDGISIAQNSIPDLLLLDIMMPDMDGYELCRQLRSDPRFHTVPIIFLSALDAMDDRIKGYTLGGDDFITKGQVDYKELGVRIKAALNRTERYREPVTTEKLGAGRVMGFLSLRGGVGVSTLALYFAQYVSASAKQPAILIDLSLPVGSVSLWSGISGPRHTIALLSRPPSEIDIHLINNFSLQNVNGSYFIPGPPTLTDFSGVRIEAVERLFSVLKKEGYFVIIDMGRGTLPLMWKIPSLCDWLAIITTSDSTARSLANVTMDSLAGEGVDTRSLLLIYNDLKNAKPSDISLGLPRHPDIFVPFAESFDLLPEPSPFTHLWDIVKANEAA
jgi:CheY-like chemotaxis protein/MinD-like ATPase involved in chromosome partitioning or flagellar assembly